MKISFRWLQELIPNLKATPQEVADKLTLSGLEVEALLDLAKPLHGIVVALVTDRQKHPNADRLSLCQVSDGKNTHQIVCGAANVEAGKKFPMATLGTTVPAGITIQKAAIRGVESSGMLCSAKELGIASESQGLLVLPDDAVVGQSLSQHLGLDDVILEVGLTPNRGDCLSHYGMAREVAALFGLKFKEPEAQKTKGSFALSEDIKVKVQSKKCVRYLSRSIRNVKVGPSPSWLKNRIESLGLRAVNNIVDATNYIMMQTGHPLHAFDFNLIDGGKLFVKEMGGVFETLDHQKRELVDADLVIATETKAIALAGIMGGANTEISQATTHIVLEAACFDPDSIRKTARRLGLVTDSSQRFERVVPSQSVSTALDLVTNLIIELAGGEASKDIFDHYPKKQTKNKIKLRLSKVEAVLGVKLSKAVVKKVLHSIDLAPVEYAQGFTVTIPVYRSDLTREIDLIEEVIRLVGFDSIPSVLPTLDARPHQETNVSRYELKTLEYFVQNGFHQTIHYSFADSSLFQKIGINESDLLALKNPLSQDLAFLRPSLLPQLILTYKKNALEKQFLHKFVELRSVFSKTQPEKKCLAGLFSGSLVGKNFASWDRAANFFDAKALIQNLFQLACVPDFIFKENGGELFHPKQSVVIFAGEKRVGALGQVHPEILKRFDVSDKLYFFEIDFDWLSQVWGQRTWAFEPLNSFPAIERDMALIADRALTFESVVKEIKKLAPQFLKSVSIFDVYEGDKVPVDKKSMAFSLTYENRERTLTDEEVNTVHFKLINDLKNMLNVSLR